MVRKNDRGHFLRKASASAAAAILALTGLGLATGAQPAHGYPDIPVTSILNDTGDVTQSTNYRVQSDSIGSSYFDGVNTVSSILQGAQNTPSRDWILDTRSSTTRTALIDLRAPVPGSGAVQIFAWQLVPTRIIVKCHETLNGSFLAIQLNQTVSCPTFVHFVYAGADYRLSMTSGPGAVADYPETNNAQVTCTAVNASNQCNAWTILPITQADGTVRNVARFENLTRRASVVGAGDFYLTFNFHVTNP
jgi:hypothetical protein